MENKKTNIYFDLDGVFADFFGEFAKKCGVSSYKEYGQDFKVFLDYCEKHIHGTDFFLHLPKFEQTDKILEATSKNFGEFFILSSPLAGDEENTARLKKEWCSKNLHIKPSEVIISKTKTDYAEGNILIDDFGPNLEKWVAAGGIGIKYKANSKNYSEKDLISSLKFIMSDIKKNGFEPKKYYIHKSPEIINYLKEENKKKQKQNTKNNFIDFE